MILKMKEVFQCEAAFTRLPHLQLSRSSPPPRQAEILKRLLLNCQSVLFSYQRSFCHLRRLLLPFSAFNCSAKVVAIIPSASHQRRSKPERRSTKEGHPRRPLMAALYLRYEATPP